MNLHLTARRILGTAFATAILAGSLAGTASAASPAATASVDWKDATKIAVLAEYPYGDVTSTLGSVEVRGPRVSWLKGSGLEGGWVKWRLIAQTAPNKNGPWTTVKKTQPGMMLASKNESAAFTNDTINLPLKNGAFVVRVISKVTWHKGETTAPLLTEKHTYTKYGLVVYSGLDVTFGDQTKVRALAPNIFPS